MINTTEFQQQAQALVLNRIPARYRDVKVEEVDKFDLNKSYYIWGKVGVGKTRLAYGLIKKDIKKGLDHAKKSQEEDVEKRYSHSVYPTIKMFNFPKMLQYIRNGIGERERYTDTLDIHEVSEEKNLVIIDDLGAEKFTEWVVETLYWIINERYERMLPTILLSNLSLEELAEKVGDRISSRIAEMCEVVKIEGKDKRLENIVSS